METNRSNLEQLVEELSQYVLANPRASDSLSGIQRWWLGTNGASEWPDRVEAALERLVERGEVECVEVQGGEPIYRAVQPATTNMKYPRLRNKK